jgi:ABC-type nitrate/sulfonate/bicarbonate transport system substrate-binding protein
MDVLADIFAPDQRQQHEDFVRRYQRGAPWEDFDDDEAVREYQRVAPRLS